MRVCGVIAEFNPFHQGHRYHLEEAKEKSNADFMVCILGCAFSQRGDAMLLSTHDRAKMALENGYDLVLGMPVSFSCAQANRFARGGVETLHRLGVITHLAFGCETDILSHLQDAARLLLHPDAGFVRLLKSGLSQGMSFAKAQGQALQESIPHLPAHLLKSPNFILGLAYLQELERLQSAAQPVVIHRATDYHSPAPGPMASAGAIRWMILKKDIAAIAEACPQPSVDIILNAMGKKAVHLPDALDKVLLARLMVSDAQSLQASPEISEGLEQRILKAARQARSREELVAMVKTKRYPFSRINRALSHLLMGLNTFSPSPDYARLLGFRKSARPLLQQIGRSGFPLIDKPARCALPGIREDMAAEQLWQLGSGQPVLKAWQEKMVVII